jgi:alpha-L-fucosidase
MKTVFITFFDIKGTIHFTFIPQGQTVNHAYHVDVLKRLFEAVRKKRPEIGPNDWILHHDNAPAHKALSVKNLKDQKSITEMRHPSYFFDSAPTDFWLFPKNKVCLKGTKISGYLRYLKKVTTSLKAIPQQEVQYFFNNGRQHRWAKCTAAQGKYLKVTPFSKL